MKVEYRRRIDGMVNKWKQVMASSLDNDLYEEIMGRIKYWTVEFDDMDVYALMGVMLRVTLDVWNEYEDTDSPAEEDEDDETDV